MTELKTLKDIEKEPNWDDKIFNAEGIYINIGRLKQEAIKWIKELKSNPKKYSERFTFYDEYGIDACGLINWIKHFYNITDEELK